jgi:hypothetical protein
VPAAPFATTRLVADIAFGTHGNDANYTGIGWLAGASDCRWASSGRSEIWLENPGKGKCFRLELDVHATEPASGANAQALSVAVRGSIVARSVVATRRTLHVLVPGSLLAEAGPVRIELQTNEIVLPPPYSTEVRQLPSVRFHAARLVEVPESEEMPALERTGALSLAELENLAGMPAAQFIARFESLGDNCEFGIVQRGCGAEPLGLLRFGAPRLHHLVECLQTQFAGFGRPENVKIVLNTTSGEYEALETRYDMNFHTWYKEGDVDQKVLWHKQVQRFGFLVRKLLEDLADGQKILVCKSTERWVPEHEIIALHDALCDFADNTLLWVTLADPDHLPGSVEILRPGLLKGYMLRLWPMQNGPEIDLESWLEVCLNAYRVARSAPAAAAGVSRKRQLPARALSPPADLAVNVTLPLLAHVQNTGDMLSDAQGWVGRSGSGLAIEGFVVLEDLAIPTRGLAYQAVLQDSLLSSKAGIGEYCGTRGQNRPIFGLRVFLENGLCSSLTYEARFTDGSAAGCTQSGEMCRSGSGAPLEAFRIKVGSNAIQHSGQAPYLRT